MVRRLPLVTDPEELLELVLGPVTHVAESEPNIGLLVHGASSTLGHTNGSPFPSLVLACQGMIRQRRQWELPPKRYFIVNCVTCQDREMFLVSAGPRGGSWLGRCPTCGAKAGGKPKAEIVDEVVDPESEENQ